MATGQRKRFTSAEKVGILKQHLLEKKAVSDICDQYGVHPTLFYRWQQEFFEKAVSVFEKNADHMTAQDKKRIADLEEKLTRKNEVLSELMEEHVALKKSLGVG